VRNGGVDVPSTQSPMATYFTSDDWLPPETNVGLTVRNGGVDDRSGRRRAEHTAFVDE
jgi:hypothetical protein